ncbi:unnamed protein product [Urochloa decumbens]|uniref:DUF6598 domain-containing protein n=1 Tax=Urochloa decumbens TaxID=240449 RepID=A0ABC9D5C3_9POAL
MYRFPSRPLLSLMASATLRWWPPAYARGVSPPMVCPNPVRGVSRNRFPPDEPLNMATISGVKGDESGKPYIGAAISPANVVIISQDNKHSAAIQGMKNIDTRVASEVPYDEPDMLGQIVNHIPFKKNFVKHTDCGEEDQRRATDSHRREIIASDDRKISEEEGYTVNNVLAQSRHRDGSIYRGMDTWWKKDYCIADRNETRLEAMAFSNPTNCIIRNGTCTKHYPRRMLQILSLKLAKTSVDCGLIELYGYIAVRDDLDPLLNYVVNFSRGDPIVVEQGSLIYMTGPKRGIEMVDLTLIEYDLRVKTGQEENDDLQLIDGASIIGPAGKWNEPFTKCIPGDYGTVEITLSRLEHAVEATVEVLISEVHSSFDLSLSCLTSGLNKGVWLFDGAIAESCSLKRSVVAVVMNSLIDLKFKLGPLSSSHDQHYCSFKARTHGHDTREIKTSLALISVRVTWSTLPSGLG